METKSVITKNCQMRERITVQAVLETPFDRLLGAHAPEPTEGIEPATCCLQDLGEGRPQGVVKGHFVPNYGKSCFDPSADLGCQIACKSAQSDSLLSGFKPHH